MFQLVASLPIDKRISIYYLYGIIIIKLITNTYESHKKESANGRVFALVLMAQILC